MSAWIDDHYHAILMTVLAAGAAVLLVGMLR